MLQYGLIGYPLAHSFSPAYFEEKFQKEGIDNANYALFEIDYIHKFKDLLIDHPGIAGLNVTIPYKESIIPYVDELSPEAAAIGAVNVIQFVDDRLIGHNSDAYGFERSLLNFLAENKTTVSRAMILGSGGAARAVYYVLHKNNIPTTTISRSPDRGGYTYDQLTKNLMDEHPLLINATPLGTAPKTDNAPKIPYEFLTANHYLYDLVYNPSTTLFMQKGKEQGAQVKNGYEMLVQQAEKAWRIWNRVEK